MSYFRPKPRRRKKDNRSTKILLTVVTAFLMITSIIGFLGNSQNTEGIDYKGYTFTQTPQGWNVKVGEEKYTFYTNPYEAEKYNLSSDAVEMLKASKYIVATFDTSFDDLQALDIARFDLANELDSGLGITVFSGVAEENSTYPLPVITCDNATSMIPVVYFKSSDRAMIKRDGFCVVLEAPTGVTALKLKDRLVYGMLGIME